ncbi:MAG: hypothetical protein WD887_01485 [Candidatus Saccharimonadales bacterium]
MAKTQNHTATSGRGLTGAVDLFWKSKDIVLRNWKAFLALNIIGALIAVFDVFDRLGGNKAADKLSRDNVVDKLSNPSWNFNTPDNMKFFVGFGILMLIVAIILEAMLVILALRSAQGESPSLKKVWVEFQEKGLRLVVQIVFVGVLTVIGFVLLVVPGIILLWRLFLAPFILVDKNTGVIESIKQSWNMTRRYAWPIYSILLLVLLIALTSVTPVVGGLIAFVLGLLYTVAPALRYEEIKKLG